ncbi:AI-2E family transporter [uncultured Friedmanniella sp.]|uniref:AI-2E family transporter n=1 Tax=uncultured Friedmanniella sp. TaxID=335381 RepID=UPI0035CB5B92
MPKSPAPAPTTPPAPDPQPGPGLAGSPPYFAILILAGLIIIGAGLKETASLITPIFLVITLVITVSPLRSFLVKRRWPSWLASTVTLLAIYALLAVILGSVVFAIYRLVATLPQYQSAFTKIFDSLLALSTKLGYGQEQISKLASSFSLSSLSAPAQSLLSGISGGASLLLLIVTVVIFLAFDAASMGERLSVIRETRPRIADGLQNFANRVRSYWIVTTVFGFAVAVLDTIALVIIGVPLYITWGVLAFVTNYIPNVGFIIGVIPPALIALLDGGVTSMIVVIVVFTVINVVVQTIIQPRFTGDAVGISSTVAFVSLVFWASLLGALGALLAIPATLFLKSVLVDNSVPANWVNALISSDPGKETPQRQRKRRATEVPQPQQASENSERGASRASKASARRR